MGVFYLDITRESQHWAHFNVIDYITQNIFLHNKNVTIIHRYHHPRKWQSKKLHCKTKFICDLNFTPVMQDFSTFQNFPF